MPRLYDTRWRNLKHKKKPSNSTLCCGWRAPANRRIGNPRDTGVSMLPTQRSTGALYADFCTRKLVSVSAWRCYQTTRSRRWCWTTISMRFARMSSVRPWRKSYRIILPRKHEAIWKTGSKVTHVSLPALMFICKVVLWRQNKEWWMTTCQTKIRLNLVIN